MVLLVGAEGVVDVSLQVDGQVRDPEQRPRHMEQPLNQPAVFLEEENTHVLVFISKQTFTKTIRYSN